MWNPFASKKKSFEIHRAMTSIRLEAIGGQGANSAGKILAEAAVLGVGCTGNHFSSFGSEKRGSPVRSFVRFSVQKRPVRTASFIRNPDVLGIFHDSLIESRPEVLEGVTSSTYVVVNSPKDPSELVWPVGFQAARVATLDATDLARRNQCGLNAVLLGGLSHFVPEIPVDTLSQTLEKFFLNRGREVSQRNLKGFEAGLRHVRDLSFRASEKTANQSPSASMPELGWMNAPLGGVIVNPGNSILKNNSASRQGVAPKFNSEICFNCGFCDMVCPDFCFVWELDPARQKSPVLKGIDYQYCKGCQKCVTVCPVEALTPVPESELTAVEKSLSLFPECLPKPNQKTEAEE